MRRLYLLAITPLALTACMEAQPAPDLPTFGVDQFQIETLAENIHYGWSVHPITQNDFLVTERGGKLFRITNGKTIEITGLPDDIYVEQQAGLFDVKARADFANTGIIYLSYAAGTAEANSTKLVRAKLTNGNLSAVTPMHIVAPLKDTAQHYGGRIVLQGDGSVLMSTGDGFVYREAAQDKNSQLGKVLSISPGGTATILSLGHRNVQGLALDRVTGQVWSHEHGPRGGDELNLIKSGTNYGWPITSHGTDYTGAAISPFQSYPGMEDPNHVWVPSIAASGLTIYRGDMFPEWQGDALVGGLMSQDIRRIDLDADGNSLGETSLFSDLGERVRDVRTAPDGSILILTDEDKGRLIRVSAK